MESYSNLSPVTGKMEDTSSKVERSPLSVAEAPDEPEEENDVTTSSITLPSKIDRPRTIPGGGSSLGDFRDPPFLDSGAVHKPAMEQVHKTSHVVERKSGENATQDLEVEAHQNLQRRVGSPGKLDAFLLKNEQPNQGTSSVMSESQDGHVRSVQTTQTHERHKKKKQTHHDSIQRSQSERMQETKENRQTVAELEAEKQVIKKQRGQGGDAVRPGAFSVGGSALEAPSTSGRPLSAKELEVEKRNLATLRKQDPGVLRPGAFAVPGPGSASVVSSPQSGGRMSIADLENERNLTAVRAQGGQEGARLGAYGIRDDISASSPRGERLSMVDLEEEKRNLARLRARENESSRPGAHSVAFSSTCDGRKGESETRDFAKQAEQEAQAARPGAFAVNRGHDLQEDYVPELSDIEADILRKASLGREQQSCRSLSPHAPTRSRGLEQTEVNRSLRNLETTVLQKTSITNSRQSSSRSLNRSGHDERYEALNDGAGGSSTTRRYIRRSSHSSAKSDELSTDCPMPGAYESTPTLSPPSSDATPGAYEALWQRQPSSYPTRGFSGEHENESLEVETRATEEPGDTLPQPLEPDFPEAYPDPSYVPPQESKGPWWTQKRTIFLLILVVVVGGVVAGVTFAMSGSGGNSQTQEEEDACGFSHLEQPPVIEQCACAGKIFVMSDDTLSTYRKLRSELTMTLYTDFDEDRTSCSSRNQALALVASQAGYEEAIGEQVRRYVLSLFYIETGGDSWNQNDGWLSLDSECSWFGISCQNNVLKKLELPLNELSGNFPTELFAIQSLETLNVEKNFRLKGEFPSEIGSLSNLREVLLDDISLTGTLPTEIGLLTKLEIINLDTTFGFMTSTIPTEVGRLSSLVTFRVCGQGFIGSIPTEFGRVTNLRQFNCSKNFFEGPFPTELYELTQLTSLDITKNQLSGTVPDISHFPDLVDIVIGFNSFDPGQRIDALWNFTEVERIELMDLRLKGSIVSEAMGRMTDLEIFDIYSNSFQGTIPSEIGRLNKLVWLDLGTNIFSGTIPTEIGLCSSLTRLNLQVNSLSGRVPSELLHIRDLQDLGLGNNALSGTIAKEQCITLDSLSIDCEEVPCPCGAICDCTSSIFGVRE